RRRHTICLSDWSSDVCSSDLGQSGAWVCDLMNAKSSTCFATFGYFSQTHAPDWPCCLKLNGDFISGPGFPLNTLMSMRCPSRFRSEERRVGEEGGELSPSQPP